MALGESRSSIVELIMQARDEASEKIEGVGESLRHITEIASGVAFGDLLAGGVEGLLDKAKELVSGFVEANSAAETLQTQLGALYGSSTEAAQAMDWMNSQATKIPFTLDSWREAGKTLVATGQDITQMLPALGNIAAAQGASITAAADAFSRADLTGNVRGLVSTLHLSKTELESFGLQLTKGGAIITSTLAPAIERLAQARFGDAMQQQVSTMAGGFTALQNEWVIFQEIAGSGLFDGIKSQLQGIIDWFNSHQGVVQQWATMVGSALGDVAAAVFELARDVMSVAVPAANLLLSAWQAVQPLFAQVGTYLEGVWAGLVDFFRQQVLPAIYLGLGLMIQWWQEHGKQVQAVLSTVWAAVQSFAKTLADSMGALMGALVSIVKLGWDTIGGVVGLALDALSGDQTKFANDSKSLWQTIQDDIVNAYANIESLTINFVDMVINGIDQVMHYMWTTLGDIAAPIDILVGSLASTVAGVFELIFGGINKAMHALHDISFGKLGWGPNQGITWNSKAIDQIMALAQDQRHSLGWAPNFGLVDTRTPQQARDDLYRAMHMIPPDQQSVADRYGSAAAMGLGKDAFAQFLAELQKAMKEGLVLKAPPGGGLGGLPGFGNLPVPGFGAADNALLSSTGLSKAQQQALDQAREQFALDKLTGASHARLMQDIAVILDDMRKDGKTALDVAYERALLLSEINKSTGQTAIHLTRPGQSGTGARAMYGTTFRAIAGESGSYGQTTVSFGGGSDPLAQLVATLREQLARADRQIAALEAQLAVQQASRGLLSTIANELGRPLPPAAPTTFRGRGIAAPVSG
ncbi:MAG TPA: hypothetical protein VFE42_20635 [Chloroflexota bacterium]|nr:hypothetical protein [Chloroflexota bacterium]